MDSSILVKLLGAWATLIHHDTSVLDRWLWLRSRLPKTNNNEQLIDIGCGTGAFTICAARRGYSSLGLSWDKRNQDVAGARAAMCGASNARFEVLDVRRLGDRADLRESFQIAICLETVEHILDDKKLFADIYRTLVPGGFLYLTTPNYYYRAITPSENGPFLTVETGPHVRRGYTKAMLGELCATTGFIVQDISYCTGFFSQKVTWLLRKLNEINWGLAWIVILPLRILPLLLDRPFRRLFRWPDYCICLEAQKPRFPN